MVKPPFPLEEIKRVTALQALKILDTPPEERFDRLTWIASRLFDSPIALISFIDFDRQWVKSHVGLSITELPRFSSFCGHAILRRDIFVIPDTKQDERFSDNPLVVEPPFVRFYAGCPLASAEGLLVGTLSVLDYRPREMSEADLKALKNIASVVEEELAGRFSANKALQQEMESRRQSEERLRESHERLQRALEASQTGTWRVDLRTGLDTRDASLNRLLGLPAEPSTQPSNDWFRYIHPSDSQRTHAAWKRALSSGLYEEEHRLIRRDGRTIWVYDRGLVFRDAAGELLYAIGAAMDITERKEAEEALKGAEARLQLALEAGQIGIWDWNIITGQLVWSRRHQELWGFAPGTFKETYEEFDARLYPEDREGLKLAIAEAVAKRSTYNHKFRVVRPDGSIHWMDGRGEPYFDEAGNFTRMIGVVRDITEQRLAEQKLSESHEQLRQLAARITSLREKERTWIAREVHDELGQLFTGIKIDLSLIQKIVMQLEPSGKTLLSTLRMRIESMSNIVDSAIRSVQRIGAEIRPGLLDDLGLLAAIEWQIKEFQSRTGLLCRLETNLQEIDLDADRATAVFRIFQESLTNIARHANATQVWVRIRRPSRQLLLVVRDNGRGISKEEMTNPMSLGLLGMQERAFVFKGKVRFRGRSSKGTVVALRIPV